jgi:hypothetical protein
VRQHLLMSASVKSGHRVASLSCPLYPQKRTLIRIGMCPRR